MSDYLAENGHIIPIIGQIYINVGVELLGIPNLHRTNGTMFTDNLLAPNDNTDWGDSVTSNQNWPVLLGGPYSNVSVAWHGAVSTRPVYMPSRPENARAAARRVCDDFLRGQNYGRLRSPYTSCNPVRNPRINYCGDNQDGSAYQYFLLQVSVASVCNISFLSVNSVSRYLWIACSIAFCVIFV